MIPAQAVEAAAAKVASDKVVWICASSFHSPSMPATVRGTYANGQQAWYCEPCAAMGVSIGMFTRDRPTK